MKLVEDYIAPVLRLENVGGRNLIRGFHGTLFFINETGDFLTAGHVIRDGQAATKTLGGFLGSPVRDPSNPKVRRVGRIIDVEFAGSPFDVAIGRISQRTKSCFALTSETKLWVWQDVHTLGYTQSGVEVSPDGAWKLWPRGFKGYITRRIPSGDTFGPPNPDAFELDFPVPRGLSGAPLGIPSSPNFELVGICVASHQSELTDYETVLVEEEGREFKETRLRVESFGIAHDLRPLAEWAPAHLQGLTLRDAIAPSDMP
jgi:hypothetical protein